MLTPDPRSMPAPSTPRLDTWSLPQIVDFVLVRYHEPLRAELPVLLDAARKVERVHADKDSCPRGLAAHLEQMDAELRDHLLKEEHVLFPAVRAGARGAQLHMPVRVMMQEHEDHGENLRLLRALARDFAPPADACATWRGLYAGLAKLEADLLEHIQLENDVLFRRVLDV